MTDPASLVLLASIGRPQGIKGEVRVKSFTGDPLALGDYGALRSADGRRFKVKRLRPDKAVVVVKFEGTNTREEAEALNGTELFIERHRLPDDNEDDEFYVTDLIGCVVVAPDGTALGTVRDAPDFGAGSVLEIAPADGGTTWLVDFSAANVPDVDLAARCLTVIRPDEMGEAEPANDEE